MSARLAEHLGATVRTRKGAVRCGPFTITLDQRDESVARNYAVADPGAQPTNSDVRALLAVFASAGRRAALEVVGDAAPAVLPALRDAGFVVDATLTLLDAAPGDAHEMPVWPGVRLRTVRAEPELRAVARVQHAAYGAPRPDAGDVQRLVDLVAAGGSVCLAEAAGEAVGAGLLTAPREGASELAAVATAAGWRRRGIAAAVSERLLRDGPELVYLMAYPNERGIYERVGFRFAGELAFCSQPSAEAATGTEGGR